MSEPRTDPSPSSKSNKPPSIRRDPWAWIALIALPLLIARAAGAPIGEPFADDFNFLRHAIFGLGSWLDGGGAVIYWRPLSRQAYYGLMADVMVRNPALTVALHLTLLAATTLLLYRAFRTSWPGPWSAAAASFPLWSEASRTLLLWPASFQDLGAIFFSALAIYQASRNRRAWTVMAIMAGLLCKETVAVTALLLPWLPFIDLPARRRWIVALGATLLVWGFVYGIVLQQGQVSFQSRFEQPISFMESLPWALGLALRDGLGLGALPRAAVAPLVTAVALVVLVAAFLVVNRAKARQRWLIGLPWIAWGLAWFLAQAALLTQVYPLWGPFRATSGAWGLGIALVATTWAAAPALLTALVALRLLALVLSAGAPALVHEAGESAFDYASLARLSRFTHETREALTTARPTLPAHGTVAWRHRPLMAQHAFAQGQALQVWYRDTTLRWISWEDVQRDFAQSPDVVLEFEPDQSRQIVVLDSAAVNAYQVGDRALSAEAYEPALLQLGRADSLQGDRQARVFLAAIAGKRALCQLALGEAETARREAEQSLASWRDGSDARYVLAVMAISEGRLEEARRQLDSLLARYPYDVSGRAMLDTVRARERAR